MEKTKDTLDETWQREWVIVLLTLSGIGSSHGGIKWVFFIC